MVHCGPWRAQSQLFVAFVMSGKPQVAAECTVTHQQAIQRDLQLEAYALADPEQFAAGKIDPIVANASNDERPCVCRTRSRPQSHSFWHSMHPST